MIELESFYFSLAFLGNDCLLFSSSEPAGVDFPEPPLDILLPKTPSCLRNCLEALARLSFKSFSSSDAAGVEFRDSSPDDSILSFFFTDLGGAESLGSSVPNTCARFRAGVALNLRVSVPWNIEMSFS